VSFDHSDTDDWQLAPEILEVDRPKLLAREMGYRVDEKPTLGDPVKLCQECDEPMYERERFYNLCKICSAKYGITRACDQGF